MGSMSELIFMACTVLAGLVACLAEPATPERWSCVKPSRGPLSEPAVLDQERDPEASEPGFADGLSSGAVA
jgi:hypothetical protein